MKRIIAFTVAGLGLAIFLVAGNAQAQNFVNETGTNTIGSREFGFDPSNLMDAVTSSVDASRCFICKNTNAGGTTAGALTNSMFGIIRTNADADLGNKSFDPAQQGMTIPTAKTCTTSGCNDAGAFTFSLPIPEMNFLSTGASVGTTNPSSTETVGDKGTKMTFSNSFGFLVDVNNSGATITGTTFKQSMQQTTFVGGGDFTTSNPTDSSGNPLQGNSLQVVTFQANGSSPSNNTGVGATSDVNWTQRIQQGGFNLGPLSGSFSYNPGVSLSSANSASAPTGPGQSAGSTSQTILP